MALPDVLNGIRSIEGLLRYKIVTYLLSKFAAIRLIAANDADLQHRLDIINLYTINVIVAHQCKSESTNIEFVCCFADTILKDRSAICFLNQLFNIANQYDICDQRKYEMIKKVLTEFLNGKQEIIQNPMYQRLTKATINHLSEKYKILGTPIPSHWGHQPRTMTPTFDSIRNFRHEKNNTRRKLQARPAP